MAGAIAIVIAILLVPVVVLMAGGVLAAALGQVLEGDAEVRDRAGPSRELLELDD